MRNPYELSLGISADIWWLVMSGSEVFEPVRSNSDGQAVFVTGMDMAAPVQIKIEDIHKKKASDIIVNAMTAHNVMTSQYLSVV